MSARHRWLLLAASWLTLLPMSARAERGDAAGHATQAPLLLRLAPSDQALHAQRRALQEQRLTRALTAWPGVQRAEVMLELPLASEQPLDLPPSRARAVVVLAQAEHSEPPALGDEEVFRLLHGVVPALERSDVTVLRHASPTGRARLETQRASDNTLVTVGPFLVSSESAAALRMGLGFSLAIHALFAGIVLWRLRPNRPAARKVDPRARTPSPP